MVKGQKANPEQLKRLRELAYIAGAARGLQIRQNGPAVPRMPRGECIICGSPRKSLTVETCSQKNAATY